jgi:hypothetical protein
MEWTTANLKAATQAVNELLARLGLQGYRFSLEPSTSGWDVRVEYAATGGWKSALLRVDRATLLGADLDGGQHGTLLRKWRASLRHAEYSPRVKAARTAEGIALGRVWAEMKASDIRDRVPADQWPDFWDDAEHGALPTDLTPTERLDMQRAANRAARERWIELVAEQRSAESAEDDAPSIEAARQELDGGR